LEKKFATQTTKSKPRRTVITIKGTDEWKAWFESFARFLRTPGSTVVDHALVPYAKESGFKDEAQIR
jgi:hypothetical protein